MAPKAKKWETPSPAVWTDNDECILKPLLAKREAAMNSPFPILERPMTPYPKDTGPMPVMQPGAFSSDASGSGMIGDVGGTNSGCVAAVASAAAMGGATTDGCKRRAPDDDGDWDQVTEKSWSAGVNEVEAIRMAAWQADVANVASLDRLAQRPVVPSGKASHIEVFFGVADAVLDEMAGGNLPDGLTFPKWGARIIKFGKLEACKFSYVWVCSQEEHASYVKRARSHLTDAWSSAQARDFGQYARCYQAIHVVLTGGNAPGKAYFGETSVKREFAA